MSKRIYRVTDTHAKDSVSLVRATSQSQAVNAVVGDRYDVAVASQDDIVQAMQAGVAVVDAKPEQQA